MNENNCASAYSIPVQNYTQIPNVIFDHWMAVLSSSEFKVLLCICRKTFGWQKYSDNISSKQIESATGLSKHTVTASIDKLIENNLIIKIKSKTIDGDDAANKFIINVSEAQILGGGRENFALGVGQILPPGVGQILPPQKKDNTKEKNTKENTPLPPDGGAAKAAREVVFSSSSSANKKDVPKDFLGEHGNCRLTADEQQKLKEKFGQAGFDSWVETIDLEAEKKGVSKFNGQYKSHYATILSWDRRRKETAGPDSNVAYHRKNSKLAFQTTKDDWVPTPIAPIKLSAEQRAAMMEELRFKS